MGKFDEAFSRGDFIRRIQKLERLVELLMGGRRLTSSSIDEDGLTVKDGFIRWLDADGKETARFATDGLSLTGVLEVIGNVQVAGDDGKLEILDADGNVQMTLSPDELSMTGVLQILLGGEFLFDDGNGDQRLRISGKADGAEANFAYRSGPTAVEGGELIIGAVFDVATQQVLGHGVLVQQSDGTDVLKATSLDGSSTIACNYASGALALQIDNDFNILYADGTTAAEVTAAEFVLVAPGSRGVVLRVTEADGIRVAVDTDAAGVQSGAMTAGAADSAGAGFRALRIPN